MKGGSEMLPGSGLAGGSGPHLTRKAHGLVAQPRRSRGGFPHVGATMFPSFPSCAGSSPLTRHAESLRGCQEGGTCESYEGIHQEQLGCVVA